MEFALTDLLVFIILPIVAFFYASVGHGGASSYLMVLALLNFAPEQIRPAALIMNMFVSMIAFLTFKRVSTFPIKLFLALSIFSIPAAYLGGGIEIDTSLYKRILGIVLFFPILKFLDILPTSTTSNPAVRTWWMAPAIGLAIGFVSGLVGIGGGIILSPILLLLGWSDLKSTAAMSALFIFLNSISGFIGAGGFSVNIDQELWILMPLTILGGALGAYWGAHKFQNKGLKYALTIVLFIAAIKLVWAG